MPKGTRLRNVRVPDEIWLPAKERAEREGTTLTAVIVQRLEEYGRNEDTVTTPAP